MQNTKTQMYLAAYTIYNIKYQQFILVIQTLKISSNTLGLGVNVPSGCLTKLLRFENLNTHLTLRGKTMHRPRQVGFTEPNWR